MLEKFSAQFCANGSVTYEQDCEHNSFKILENADYRWLTMGSNVIQSFINLSEPNDVLLPYTQAMLLALAFHKKPLRLLNLGTGCGTFERFLYSNYPDINITSVESNVDIIDIARKYFHFPADHSVFNEDADCFLKNDDSQYDIIFCDLFDGKSHPAYFTDPCFYKNVADCLNDDAVFVMNMIPGSEKVMMDILLAVRKHFRWQSLLDFDDYGNIILFIFRQEPRILKSSDVLCAALMKRLKIDLDDFINRLVLFPEANDLE